MLKNRLISALIAASLVGCGIKDNVRSGGTISVDNESAILVLGVSPRYRIHLTRGLVADGVWIRPKLDVPEVNIFPEDGYIVVKVKPTTGGERLGVSLIFPEGKPFKPCQDANNPTFELKAGVVTYAGELLYRFDGATLQYSSSLNESKVKEFLSAKYPGDGYLFEVHPMQIMKVKSDGCNPINITIPIYLPKR